MTKTIRVLSSSPDFHTTIESLAALATTNLSDWCGVFMFEHDQTVRRLAVVPASHVEALYPIDANATTGPAHVLRTGQQQLLANIEERQDIAGPLGLENDDLKIPDGPNAGRPSVYLCMPAVARNRTVGAIVLMSAGRKTAFNETQIGMAASLADAAAVAIDSARLHRDAKEANRLKDEFVAMVSHELRTPLTPILGCIHLLRTSKLSQANIDRALEMIERNANAQVQVVEDLLDASRIVSGKLRLDMISAQLTPVLEFAVESVRSSAAAKSIQIVTNFDDSRRTINGDPHRLQQIVWNLLSNAVKFTPPDGRIEVSLADEDDHVEIQVKDTGVGIPADRLPFIFDRFRQGRDSGSQTGTGLGLGLAIVRHLVELHNGSIEAASAGPGQGSVFTVRFPYAAHKAVAAGKSGS